MRNLATWMAILLVSCGGDPMLPPSPTPPVQNTPPWQNKAAQLLVASPGSLAVGDELTILGQDFIPADRGDAVVVLKGTFFDAQGKQHPVELQTRGRRVSPTKVTWKLWPNVVFSPSGDQLGYFLGDVKVVNQASDGSQLVSNTLPLKVEVKPSLIPRVARPTTGGCQSVVGSTLGETGFAFTVEVIGLRPATKEAPLTFFWTFLTDHFKVSFGNETFNPDSILPKKGAVLLEDRVTEGVSSTVQDGGSRNFLLKIGADLIGDTRLKELRTQPVPDEGNNYEASVNVAVVDSTGKSARLALPLNVHKLADLVYDGSARVAERLPPTMVSDCIPGGDIGRHVTYREDKAESRQRGMSFQYNASAGLNLGLPSNPFALGVNFSAGFGRDVNASVSSSQTKSLDINGQILPGLWGTFYRQTTKVLRMGKLVGHTKCGQTVDLGDAVLTDWVFTPDLATGTACPPPSKLPRAEKFL